jgi:hypothetical protein
MARRWRGTLLREGVETGDHRIIDEGATTWRELPRDLGCVFEDGWGGHENAIVVGTIEIIERRGADIYGEGAVLLADENADRWVNANRQGALRGCSVDLTDGECIIEVVNRQTGEVLDPEIGIEVLWGPEGDDFYVRERWTAAEIGSTAVCRVPAFAEALIEVYDTDDTDEAVESIEPDAEVTAAAEPVATFAAIADVAVGQRVRWTDAEGNDHDGEITAVDEEAETVTIVEQVDDEPVTVIVPVADVTIDAEDESDDEDEGDDDEASAYSALRRRTAASASPRPALAAMLARERGEPVRASIAGTMTDQPVELHEHGAVVQAAVSWGSGPPAEAFARRQLPGPTPFTIEDEGTIVGHLRLHGQCHMGYMGGSFNRCVMVPDSPSNYALFHANRQVRCDDGSRVPVGVFAMDTPHAPAGRPGRRPSLAATQRWYEDTGLQFAYLHAYDDEWGTQVVGILRDGLSVDDARRGMASSPSGDWRDYGGGLDLTGVTMVNVPGYPVYEIEDEAVTVLMASLSPPPGIELVRASSSDAESGACGGSCGCGGTCGGGAARSSIGSNPRLRRAALEVAFAGSTPPAG